MKPQTYFAGKTSNDDFTMLPTKPDQGLHPRNSPRIGKQWRRDVLIALSLANLVLLRVWSELLTAGSLDGYTMRHPPRPVDLGAAMLDVCLLAALFYAAATFLRRFSFGPAALQWAIVLSLGLPINALRQVLANSWFVGLGAENFRHGGGSTVITAGSVAACLAVGALAVPVWRRRLARLTSAALLAGSPFVLLTFSRAAIRAVQFDPAIYADGKLASPIQTGLPERRVVWVIFDEMDERLTFVNRSASVQLPEFDALRAASFSAVDAQSPARVTVQSLPALLTGRQVIEAQATAPDDLLLKFESGATAHWRGVPNLFSRAREAGLDSALAGWYHPYGRILNRDLTRCVWVERPNLYNSTGDSLPQVAVHQLRSVMETSLLSPFGQSLPVKHHVDSYRRVLSAGISFASDPGLGIVFLHFPVPHAPYIFNLRTGQLDLANSPVAGYNGGLALADRSLGQLRAAMQASGVWDRTAVLVSADHGYRGAVSVDGGKIADHWVPFLLKLPGHQEPFQYSRRLETLNSAGLLLDILAGKIKTTSDVAAWLDATAGQISAAAPAGRSKH